MIFRRCRCHEYPIQPGHNVGPARAAAVNDPWDIVRSEHAAPDVRRPRGVTRLALLLLRFLRRWSGGTRISGDDVLPPGWKLLGPPPPDPEREQTEVLRILAGALLAAANGYCQRCQHFRASHEDPQPSAETTRTDVVLDLHCRESGCDCAHFVDVDEAARAAIEAQRYLH